MRIIRIRREVDADLEQIPVQIDLKLSALRFYKILRNGKPQSASFRAAADIPSDETLRQLIRRNIQWLCGNILDRYLNSVFIRCTCVISFICISAFPFTCLLYTSPSPRD